MNGSARKLEVGATRRHAAGATIHMLLALWPLAGSAQYVAWSGQTANLPYPHIAVTSFGEVEVAPDRATIYLTLTAQDVAPPVAVSELAALRARVAEAVAPLGIMADEVTTWGYGAGSSRGYPGVSRGAMQTPDVLVEYGARTGVRIVLDSIGLLDDVIGAALGTGDVAVPMVTFEAVDVGTARAQAVALAMERAVRDAESLARAAGGELGELLYATTSPATDFGRQLTSRYQGGPGSQPPLQPSDVVVRVMVSAAWRLGN